MRGRGGWGLEGERWGRVRLDNYDDDDEHI